jgi:transmembrane sensor
MIAKSTQNLEEAAIWASRMAEHAGDRDVEAELRAWLAADPQRRGALLRARAVLSLAAEAAQDGAEASADLLGKPSRRRVLALGTGLAAAGAAAFVLVGRWRTIGTGLGEVRKAPLPDGSLVAVNTESQVAVRMQADRRQVRLSRGEAWFKVAHDASRPFVVETGDVRVRAVGTAFSVRRWDETTQVLVTEGAVDVWRVGEEADVIRVTAGSYALVSRSQPVQAVAASMDLENALAWRDGQIALYGDSLASAAVQFNRYNARKLIIDDPQLASEKVVGQFSANDPEAFAASAATMLGARMTADQTSIRLSR